jgi:hypothetical protein
MRIALFLNIPVRSDILVMMAMKIMVFWDVTLNIYLFMFYLTILTAAHTI